jgi:hypothetical protein
VTREEFEELLARVDLLESVLAPAPEDQGSLEAGHQDFVRRLRAERE